MTEHDSAFVMSLHGELDMLVLPQMSEQVDRILRQAPEALVIDLRELDFMDSSGVHAILSADRACREQGTRLVLIRGGTVIDRLFRMCGLERRFDFIRDPDELRGDATIVAA